MFKSHSTIPSNCLLPLNANCCLPALGKTGWGVLSTSDHCMFDALDLSWSQKELSDALRNNEDLFGQLMKVQNEKVGVSHEPNSLN